MGDCSICKRDKTNIGSAFMVEAEGLASFNKNLQEGTAKSSQTIAKKLANSLNRALGTSCRFINFCCNWKSQTNGSNCSFCYKIHYPQIRFIFRENTMIINGFRNYS